jgi:hypothetical protein
MRRIILLIQLLWCRAVHRKHHSLYWTEYSRQFYRCPLCGCCYSRARVLLLIGLLLCLAPHSHAANTNTITLQMSLTLDSSTFGGLSTNDYLTNITILIYSSPDCTVPTNQWPIVAVYPASQFLNQGLPPVYWTNQLAVDGATRFYLMQSTNGNGAFGPFSRVVPFFWSSPSGRVSAKL